MYREVGIQFSLLQLSPSSRLREAVVCSSQPGLCIATAQHTQLYVYKLCLITAQLQQENILTNVPHCCLLPPSAAAPSHSSDTLC